MSHFAGPLLPKDAIPSAYDLRLDLDVVAGTFTGTVAVNVKLLKEDRFIVLNGIDLSVDRDASSFTPCEPCEVVLKGGDLSLNSSTITSSSHSSKFGVVAIKYYEEKIILEFDSYLPRGEGVLNLVFNGRTTKALFINCGENEKKSARRFFPCWDEPVYKARFKITLQVPLEFVAVTNMPFMEENVEGNWKITSYHESSNIPTYLVTIVVGLLEPSMSSEFLHLFKSREATSQVLEQTEILVDDIVMNLETERVSRVVCEDEKLFLFPIDKAEKEELRSDEVVVVSRPFFHGQPVCLVRDRKKLGIICGLDIKVDLASSGRIAHHNIGTESLERNRKFVVADTVVCGSWFGVIQDVKLTLQILLRDGKTITAYDAEPRGYEPIFTNAAEAWLNEPYYLGQEVLDLVDGDDDPDRVVVTKHKVDRVKINWTHCSSSREEKKPLKYFDGKYGEIRRIHDPIVSRVSWALGSRCTFEGKEFLIAGIRSKVKVKWQGGFVEEISSSELMESKEFFSGQFVAKKEDKGVEGCVRMVVDGLAWVKWFQGENSELLHTSELQPHLDYQFQISDVVAEKFGSRALGFIVGMGMGKLKWSGGSVRQ